MAKESETPSAAEGDRQTDSQESNAKTKSEEGKQDAPKSNGKDAWIGALIWAVIILVGGYIWLRGNVAEVYIDVSPTDPRVLTGVVLYDGVPVSSGRAVIETWEPSHRKLMGSAVLEVGPDGRFATKAEDLPAEIDAKQALHIVATYVGSVKTADKEDAKPTKVTGAADLFLNQSPPMSLGFLIPVGAVLMIVLCWILWLCTLALTEGRARWLFRLTYVLIVLALCVPILLIAVATRSEQVVNAMQQAPVGLVKGRSEAVKKPQWLVNIGGAVRPAAPAAPAATSEPRAGVNAVASAAKPPEDTTPYVEGGLVVPFFVLILALLGGAINMTMKVPSIQERYQVATLPTSQKTNVVAAIAKAPVALLSASDVPLDPKQAKVVSGIRRSLITQYMFLLSAPFLAIAVYYLLQVVAREVEEPVLVLMSFATGIVSDKIVKGIGAFAENVLQSLRRGRGGEDRAESAKAAAAAAAKKV